MPYTVAFLCSMHLEMQLHGLFSAFHCSFTAKEVPVEYVIITKADLTCWHHGPELASAIQGVCRHNSQFWSKPRTFHSLSCPVLKDRGFLLHLLKGKATKFTIICMPRRLFEVLYLFKKLFICALSWWSKTNLMLNALCDEFALQGQKATSWEGALQGLKANFSSSSGPKFGQRGPRVFKGSCTVD